MRISEFHIDGFGIFHNQSISEIPGGLSVFIGDNEAGKTTLMEFIRTTLFGYTRKGNRNGFPPLRGGNYGGRLRVVTQDGRSFVVERQRHSVTIAQEGDSPENIEPSEKLLGGIDRQTFERVFAVGLKDLQGLDVLSEERAGGRLAAIGVGLGCASLPSVMKKLDDEIGVLVSLRGKQQRFNQLKSRLEEVGKEIKNLQGQSAEYAQFKRKQLDLEADIASCMAEGGRARTKLRRLQQLQQGREHWVHLTLASNKAEKLELARSFPAKGMERFESLKESIERLSTDKSGKDIQARRFEEQLLKLDVDQTLIEHTQEIESLAGERARLASAVADYPEVRSKAEQAEKDFKRHLQELGHDWTREKLDAIDTSVQVRQRVQLFGMELDKTARSLEQALERVRSSKEKVADAKRVLEEAHSRMEKAQDMPVSDAKLIGQRVEALRMMRIHLHSKDVNTARLDADRMLEQERAERIASLQHVIQEPAKLLSSWLPLAALAIGLIMAIGLGVQHSYVAMGIVLIVAGGVWGFLRGFRRREAASLLARKEQFAKETQAVKNANEKVAEHAAKLQNEIKAAIIELDKVAANVGLERPDDQAQLERISSSVELAADRLREWQGLEREENKSQEGWKTACEKLDNAEKALEDARIEADRHLVAWKAWLSDRGFTGTIRPEGFEVILQAIESARISAAHLQECRKRSGQIEKYLTQVRARITNLLVSCGRTQARAEVGVEHVEELSVDLHATREALRRQEDLRERLAAEVSATKQIDVQLQEKRREIEQLMQLAGAGNEEQFRIAAALHSEWRECLGEVEAENKILATISGAPESVAEVERELKEIDPLRVLEEIDHLSSKLEELEKKVSEYNQEVGSLKDKLERMGNDNKLGELLLNQCSLQAQLVDATRCWARLVVCRSLLEKARGVYERERQPLVIQEAGRFLHILTDKRYRLLAPLGGRDVQLEDAALKRKEEIIWSSGLADQVYLSVRLGLAHEFGRHHEPLPVILDDILVRFDPTRQVGAARAILKFAGSQQVLVFSCHPWVGQVFENVSKEFGISSDDIAYFSVADGAISRRDSIAKALP